MLTCASHEVQHVGSLQSFYTIKTREGDERAVEWRTRGDEARERFVATFLEDEKYGDEDGLLLTDGDQRQPVDLLEGLRTSMEVNGLDMVCAHYYRRETRPVQSLCYPIGDGNWPYLPFLDPPTEGLHELAATGFGCVLIKKKVLKAVQAILPPGASPIGIGTLPEVDGQHMNWGPDFRFFYNARKCGYKLWLDASIESLHAVTLWLGHKSAAKLIDYTGWADAAQNLLEKRLELLGMSAEAFKQRLRILEARERGLRKQYDDLAPRQEEPEVLKELQQISVAVYEMSGRIKECQAWLKWETQWPKITTAEQLPTHANMPEQPPFGTNEAAERTESYKQNAQDLIDELPMAAPDAAKIGANGNGPH